MRHTARWEKMIIGSFSIDDGDGSKNVAFEKNCVISDSVAFIPIRWKCQMQAHFLGVDLLGTTLKFRKRKKNSSSLVYVLHKRGIRHFQVVDVRWGQRNVQKRVMHVQSCCFANKTNYSLPFTLPSSLSLLKLPKNKATVVDGINSPCSVFFLTALTPEPEHMHQACSSSCRGILWRTWSPGY